MKTIKSTSALLFILISSFTQAQDIFHTLSGKWSWVSYSGGIAGLPPTPATDYYSLSFMNIFDTIPSLPDTTFYAMGNEDTSLLFTRRLTINRDSLDFLFYYNFQPDILNMLFGYGDTTSIDLRIISDDSIEFTHKHVADDFTYLFVRNCCNLFVKTGTSDIFGGPLPWDQIAYYTNAVNSVWTCGGQGFARGLTFAVFDSTGCTAWESKLTDYGIDPITGYQYNTVHKNIHCRNRDVEYFDFPTVDSSPGITDILQQRIIDFINSVPDGYHILVFSVNAVRYDEWSQDLVDAFTALGSTSIYWLYGQSNIPWVFFVKKGQPATAMEQVGASYNDIVEWNTAFNCLELVIDTTGDTTTVVNLLEKAIFIQPNPATEMVQINYDALDVGRITLWNLIGEQLQEINQPVPHQTILNLNNIEKGIYFLHIETSEGNLIKKLVKN